MELICFSIAFSMGLVKSSEVLSVIKKFSLIFNVDTASLKKLFNSLAIRSSSYNISSFSTSLIYSRHFPCLNRMVKQFPRVTCYR